MNSARLVVQRTNGACLVGAMAMCGEDGRFELPHLQPGRYAVAVERPGLAPLRFEAQLPGSGHADLEL